MTRNTNGYSSMSDTKKSYRLYAGHGNWINLDTKTTQDLSRIFERGVPCRYQLVDGLFIDIIPNDVDCNSRNIDMQGLMRADIVIESQTATESQIQQRMSTYIRNLLEGQGIIDAFPPVRFGEDLPIVTSLPVHRHLSLVPSVVGAVRRGPKPFSANNSVYQLKNAGSITHVSTGESPYSDSSSQGHNDCDYSQIVLSSDVNDGAKKRIPSYIPKRVAKKSRQHSSSPIELGSSDHQHPIILANNNISYSPINNSNSSYINSSSVAGADGNDHHTLSYPSYIPINYENSHQWNSANNRVGSPTSSSNTSEFNNFGFVGTSVMDDFSHRHSPTEILHDYEHFNPHLALPDEHNYHHHTHEGPLISNISNVGVTAVASSGNTSIDSLLPSSPIQNSSVWTESNNSHALTRQNIPTMKNINNSGYFDNPQQHQLNRVLTSNKR